MAGSSIDGEIVHPVDAVPCYCGLCPERPVIVGFAKDDGYFRRVRRHRRDSRRRGLATFEVGPVAEEEVIDLGRASRLADNGGVWDEGLRTKCRRGHDLGVSRLRLVELVNEARDDSRAYGREPRIYVLPEPRRRRRG